jgi:SAM-dependent methyltransferase
MPRKWQSPLYEIQLPSRRIVVNVTRSCPGFSVPTPGVPDVAAALRRDGYRRVLDFGAGKLRNTLFLLSLKAGFSVWAVEFKDCFETPAGQQRLAEAQKHKEFFLKKWPDEFLKSTFVVDAVLLVNVANVVPQETDRRRIISECTKRLRSGGLFLWMSQYGEPHYKPGVTKRLRAPDGGWFYNLDNEHQTYYKEFTIPEIKAYFSDRVYREVRKINSPHHRAFLFEKR